MNNNLKEIQKYFYKFINDLHSPLSAGWTKSYQLRSLSLCNFRIRLAP